MRIGHRQGARRRTSAGVRFMHSSLEGCLFAFIFYDTPFCFRRVPSRRHTARVDRANTFLRRGEPGCGKPAAASCFITGGSRLSMRSVLHLLRFELSGKTYLPMKYILQEKPKPPPPHRSFGQQVILSRRVCKASPPYQPIANARKTQDHM